MKIKQTIIAFTIASSLTACSDTFRDIAGTNKTISPTKAYCQFAEDGLPHIFSTTTKEKIIESTGRIYNLKGDFKNYSATSNVEDPRKGRLTVDKNKHTCTYETNGAFKYEYTLIEATR